MKIEAQNSAQMEFSEVKIKDKIELQNDDENGVGFEDFTPVLSSLRTYDEDFDHICQKERQNESLTNQGIATTKSEI